MANDSDSGILDGIRVLDFTQYIAGPVMGKLMADMGAEVIKLEPAPKGDMQRTYPPLKGGMSGVFLSENRGKKSVCLDIKRSEGLELLKDLVRRSDVLIENWTPGVLARYGVSYDVLQPLNPRLIMCSISGFGQTGPDAHKPGNDLIASAASGMLNLVGYPDDSPLYPGGNIADNTGGVHGLAAVCAALFRRERTGKGQYVEVSLVECLGHYNSLGIVARGFFGPDFNQTRAGAHNPSITPFGIFKARDGYVAISVLIHQWEIFADVIGRPDLANDPQWADARARMAHQPEVIKLVEDWLQSFPSRDQPLALLDKAHILSAPVRNTRDVMEAPQNQVRGALCEIEQPGIGKVTFPRAPFNFSDARTAIPGRAPLLGEHNEAVLTEVLGYPAAKIEALKSSGVLIRDSFIDELRARGELDNGMK